MNFNCSIFFKLLNRKAVIVLFIVASTVTAFATLGDGKAKGKRATLINNKLIITPGRFTLKSGYKYRGSQIINQQRENSYITLNSRVTYQKGNMTYIIPMKTSINSQKIKVSVGVPQLNKN